MPVEFPPGGGDTTRDLRLTAILENFEQEWQRETPPDLDAFLGPPERPGRPLLLIELIHIDLERRLRAGLLVRVEDYLGRYPQLAAHPADLAQLLLTEIRFRRRRGDAVSPDEYTARFPFLAERLYRLFAEELTTVNHTPLRPRGPDAAGGTESRDLELPDYEILGELGRGAMGVVYKARQVKLNRSWR